MAVTAGRVAQLFVDEGDMVKAAQIVATMDTRDLAASLKKAQSLASQAQQVLGEAQANLAQLQTQVTLARQELDRTTALVPPPTKRSSRKGAMVAAPPMAAVVAALSRRQPSSQTRREPGSLGQAASRAPSR